MQYRIWRSPYARFGGLNSLCPDDSTDETVTALHTYTDSELKNIAENGFNAFWVHAVPANIARSDLFPEFGKNAERHMDNMSRLIERADRFGLKVFLYFQPVRSVAAGNVEFWKNHADCIGQHETATEQVLKANLNQGIEMYCLCTSVPKVKQWVRGAASQMAEKLPGLGGVILITGSEYPGHCYSHRTKVNPTEWSPLIECPRCRERQPHEVAAELVNLVRDGIREHSASMEIIAWNWSWTSWLKTPCRPLLELLPHDVTVMACCERGGTMDLAERPNHPVNEYSLIYGGPSEVCTGTLAEAEKLGMRQMTKLQLGATHELANVVSLPMMNSIYAKADWHRKHPDVGYMGCWNCGNFFSANTYGFNYFLRPARPDGREEAIRAFAGHYFPGCDAWLVAKAWDNFEHAAKYFPYAIPFLYRGVHTCALSYAEIFRAEKLRGTPFGCSYLPLAERGDDLTGSFTMQPHEFTLDELIGHLGKMAVLWRRGVDFLAEGLEGCDEKHELGNAVICGCIWQSSENIYRAWRLRRNWEDSRRIELKHIVLSELETVGTALPWVEKDERQGWHGEAFERFFDPESMRRKALFLEAVLMEL